MAFGRYVFRERCFSRLLRSAEHQLFFRIRFVPTTEVSAFASDLSVHQSIHASIYNCSHDYDCAFDHGYVCDNDNAMTLTITMTMLPNNLKYIKFVFAGHGELLLQKLLSSSSLHQDARYQISAIVID